MEVVPGERPLIRDYWPTYRNRKLLAISTAHVIGTLILVLLFVYGRLVPLTPASLTMLFVISLTMLLVEYGLFFYVTQPIKSLTAALAHTAGEETALQLPNPNSRINHTNGLRPLLYQIYSLGAKPVDDLPAASAEHQLLGAALSNTSASMVIMDADQRILYASDHAPVHRDTDNQLKLDIIFEDDNDLTHWLSKNANRKVRSEIQWLRVSDRIVGDDERRIFDVIASFEKSSPAEVVLLFVDRTGHYQPEDDQLDFVSFAAHELRGPITVIRGYLDVLSDELGETIEEDQRILLDRLTVSANRLSGYINNILNASRFDRRHLKIHPSEEKLSAVYDTVSDDMDMRAVSQNRLLSVTIPDTLPTVAADASSLSEVFSNLIDNAIKYSNEGGSIEVSAAEENGFVRVDIRDHGIGIPANLIGNLFHKFYRSHRSRETVAGTGIGLYICRAIVESHGGHIEVSSEEGEGSTFSFTVPIYATVADKIESDGQYSAKIIRSGNEGWIKNHAKFRG